MKKLKVNHTQLLGLGIVLLLGFSLSGCGREQAQSPLPPSVVSVTPADGTVGVALNSTVTATFSAPMAPASFTTTTFVVAGPGGVAVAGTFSFAGTVVTFTPTIPLTANTLYTGLITTGTTDTAGNALSANFPWSFMTGALAVVSTVPMANALDVTSNSQVTATFNSPLDSTTVLGTSFFLTGPGGTPVVGSVSSAGETATFAPQDPLANGTIYTATITTAVRDLAGNALANNFVWTFTTAVQPRVTFTNPGRAAINVPINTKIGATFNVPMDPTTITAAGTFTLAVTAGGAAVPGAVTYDAASKTALFKPTANLAASTQFTATVTTAAHSAAGEPLPVNYTWNFTTGTTGDTSLPSVSSTNPADGATLVPLNQFVVATFSEAMDPSTISATGTVAVTVTLGGAAVPGTLTYDTASRTAVFKPTANLTAATGYTVTISAAAKDLGGNALVAGPVPNPWTFTTGTTVNNNSPTITVTQPASGANPVDLDATVNATFSAPMDPTTINNTTFTVALAGPGGTPVDGTVSYDAASQIATFTPSANLTANTTYTATIANTVTDQSGNALVTGGAPNPWNFTTGTATGTGQARINLASAGNFAIMSTSSITSTGPVQINGDVGLDPGTSQGIPPAQVNGTIHINDPIIAQAQTDLLAAYNDASTRSTNSQPLPGNMGGLTFAPGLYTNSTSVLIQGAGPGNNVTLDAQGDPNAVFIFQMGSTLTTSPGSQVILAGGAKATNVFWQVGSSATIDTTTIFKGNILAAVSITMNTGAVVEGRMFAGSTGGAGSVTVNASSVTVPAP